MTLGSFCPDSSAFLPAVASLVNAVRRRCVTSSTCALEILSNASLTALPSAGTCCAVVLTVLPPTLPSLASAETSFAIEPDTSPIWDRPEIAAVISRSLFISNPLRLILVSLPIELTTLLMAVSFPTAACALWMEPNSLWYESATWESLSVSTLLNIFVMSRFGALRFVKARTAAVTLPTSVDIFRYPPAVPVSALDNVPSLL